MHATPAQLDSARRAREQRDEKREAEIQERLAELDAEKKRRSGFLAGLLGRSGLPPTAQAELNALQSEWRTLYYRRQPEVRKLLEPNTVKAARVTRLRDWIAKLEDVLSRKPRPRDRIAELKAAAAANARTSRGVAASVRRELAKQPWCPYCGAPLGDHPPRRPHISALQRRQVGCRKHRLGLRELQLNETRPHTGRFREEIPPRPPGDREPIAAARQGVLTALSRREHSRTPSWPCPRKPLQGVCWRMGGLASRQ